jgi:hypothetical protein
MKLYIANVSRFRAQFNYRPQMAAPGSGIESRRNGMKIVQLNPRQCVPLPEMTQEEIMFVVDQAKASGAMMVDDVKKVPNYNVVFLMAIDSPIGPSMMTDLHKHNVVLKTNEGSERRRLAAVGVNAIVERHVDAQLKGVEIEMEQMDPFVDSGREPEGKPVAQGFKVERAPNQQPQPPKGKRGRR